MPKKDAAPKRQPNAPDQQKTGFFTGFLEFVREQGVVGFAIGFILGAASTTLVKSLVDNIITPLLDLLLGSAGGLKGLKLYLGSPQDKALYLQYGQFLNDIITFLILLLVIYVVAKLLRLDRLDKKKS